MLYAKFENLSPLNELEWHVGDVNTDKLHIYADGVTFVQADGDELEHIRSHQLAQCPVGKRVVRFYGDDAKRILGNL